MGGDRATPVKLSQYLPIRRREGFYFSRPALDAPVAYHAHETSGVIFACGRKEGGGVLLRATSKRPEWKRVLELPSGRVLSEPVFYGGYAYFGGMTTRRRTIAVYRVNLRSWDVRHIATPVHAKGTLRITGVLSPRFVLLSETRANARRWKADLITGQLTALVGTP